MLQSARHAVAHDPVHGWADLCEVAGYYRPRFFGIGAMENRRVRESCALAGVRAPPRHFCGCEAEVRTICEDAGERSSDSRGVWHFPAGTATARAPDMRNLANALDGDWSRVSETSPCPICGSDRSCRTHVDEAFACCVQRPSDWRLTNGGWLHRVQSTATQIVSRLAQQPENLSTDWKALPSRPGAHP